MITTEEYSAIRSYALNDSTYTEITSPGPYNYYEIIGTSDGSAMMRSSDGTDAHGYPFGQSSWFSFLAAMTPWGNPGRTRFAQGDIATYLKAATGSPNVYVEWSI